MELKRDTTISDNNIFIYGKLGPTETASILFSKVAVMEQSIECLPRINLLKIHGGKLWLIRDSRMDGLLTVQSLGYDPTRQQWQENNYERYMLSNNHGWMLNGKEGAEFEQKIKDAGGIVDMSKADAAPHVQGLLNILSDSGYLTYNRVNPKKGEETKVTGYSKYVDSSVPRPVFFQPQKTAGDTMVSLPEGILMSLSCPLTIAKTGCIQLMRDPVTLLRNGISYERETLWVERPFLEEGVDYYPNIKLKSIISYVSAVHLGLDGYLDKLAKVESDITDPVELELMTQPTLSPSGLSYEKSVLDRWIRAREAIVSNSEPVLDPLTNQNIRGKPLVENINLKLFIKFWPDFYKSRQAMKTEALPNDLPLLAW